MNPEQLRTRRRQREKDAIRRRRDDSQWERFVEIMRADMIERQKNKLEADDLAVLVPHNPMDARPMSEQIKSAWRAMTGRAE